MEIFGLNKADNKHDTDYDVFCAKYVYAFDKPYTVSGSNNDS